MKRADEKVLTKALLIGNINKTKTERNLFFEDGKE